MSSTEYDTQLLMAATSGARRHTPINNLKLNDLKSHHQLATYLGLSRPTLTLMRCTAQMLPLPAISDFPSPCYDRLLKLPVSPYSFHFRRNFMFFHLTRSKRRLYLGAAIAILLVLVPLLVFFLSPSSRASREPDNSAKPSAQKRQRPQCVPGQVLIRYRSEAIARRQQNRVTIPLREGRTIPFQLGSFDGAKL